MNLPNKLTCLRIVIVPFFVAGMLLNFKEHYLIAYILFLSAALTDLLDGYIARKRGLITTFGKFLDPLADKILVVSALVCMVKTFSTPAAVVIIIIAREFMVTSLRLVAAPMGVVIAADKIGKAKTLLQMTWILTAVLQMYLEEKSVSTGCIGFLQGVNSALMCVVTALTVVSGAHYLIKYRDLLKDK